MNTRRRKRLASGNEPSLGKDYMSRLPNEIMLQILELLPEITHNGSPLYACCLINKRWNSLATEILYRHIVLAYRVATGFLPKNKSSLCNTETKSLKYARRISVVTVEADVLLDPRIKLGKRKRPPSAEEVETNMGRHFLQFIGYLDHTKIESIGSDWPRMALHLPSELQKKVKGLGVILRPPNKSWAQLAGLRKTGKVPSHLQSQPYQNLESLVLEQEADSLSESQTGWEICLANSGTLKRFVYRGYSGNISGDRILHGRMRLFDSLEFLQVHHGVRKLDVLEDLSLEYQYNIEPDLSMNAFSKLIHPEKIKRFRAVDLAYCQSFAVDQALAMRNLTDLTLIDATHSLRSIENMLEKMTCRLRSLILRHNEPPNSAHEQVGSVRREPFETHSATLRKLWIHVKDSNAATEEYSRDMPIRASESEAAYLDLETLSAFPYLEYLAVAAQLPQGAIDVEVPVFCQLRGMHFITFQNVSKSGLAKVERQYEWFKQPYDKAFMTSEWQPKLQIVSFGHFRHTNSRNPKPTLYSAYLYRFKDRNSPQLEQDLLIEDRELLEDWNSNFAEFLEEGEPELAHLYPKRWAGEKVDTRFF